ncbi:MAG: hypothetical protein AAGC60_10645 [Acidobacteriota bacterium]
MPGTIRRPPSQPLGRCLLCVCVFTLLMPPQLLAESHQSTKVADLDWPKYFAATFTDPDQGELRYEYFKQADGSLFYRTKSSSQLGSVEKAAIEGIEIKVLNDDGGRFDTVFSVPDGLGGKLEFSYYGSWDARKGIADGTLITPGGESRSLRVDIPSNSGTTAAQPTKAVIIISIGVSAAAISAIGCFWNAWRTDCAADCAAACTAGGGSLKSSSEGWCGSCTCICNPPPECDSNGLSACAAYEATAVPLSAFR